MFLDSNEVEQELHETKVTPLSNLSAEELNNLFSSDIQNNTIISGTGQVEGYLFAINKLVNDISNLKDLKKNSVEFYNNKIESTERTIDILKDRISEFMLSSDNSKIPTQAGTAYFTKRIKEIYPDDETLIEFSKQNKLEMTVKISPNKKAIKDHIKNGGSVPEGYFTHEVTSLSIRK